MDRTRTVTLNDLLQILTQRIVIIVLAAVVCVGGIFIYSKTVWTPKYQSTASIYIMRQSDSASVSEQATDLAVALKMVNDCSLMLKSYPVLRRVQQQVDFKIAYGALSESISVVNPTESRMLYINVKADTGEHAKQIADAVASIGVEVINNTVKYEQVTDFDTGKVSTVPCNTIGLSRYLLFGVAGAALAYLVFLILFLFDDSIKTDEDIQQYFGVNVLAVIPDADVDKKKKYGYRYGCGDHSNRRRSSALSGEEKQQ